MSEIISMRDSLALLGVFLAIVVAVEELSIEQLDGDDRKNEVEEEVHH